MSTILNNVEYLLKKVPPTANNDMLLVLLYWTYFDNIDLPSNIINSIMEKATAPETILRHKRRLT